jgi:hypothetical protein
MPLACNEYSSDNCQVSFEQAPSPTETLVENSAPTTIYMDFDLLQETTCV